MTAEEMAAGGGRRGQASLTLSLCLFSPHLSLSAVDIKNGGKQCVCGGGRSDILRLFLAAGDVCAVVLIDLRAPK